jgi:hypothetical protein
MSVALDPVPPRQDVSACPGCDYLRFQRQSRRGESRQPAGQVDHLLQRAVVTLEPATGGLEATISSANPLQPGPAPNHNDFIRRYFDER